MRICSTGFARIDLLHLSKLVELMGASYDEYLTSKASVLICNDPQSASHDKLRHAAEWGIPALSADWLWISIQNGQKKPFEPYIVRRKTAQGNGSIPKPGAQEQSHRDTDGPRDEPSRGSTESSHKDGPNKPAPKPIRNTRSMPIIGDGFSEEEDPNEPPKPSVPESRSPSPNTAAQNQQSEDQTSDQPAPDQTTPPAAAPSALDTALKGLLQQAQAAKTRQQTEKTPTNEDDSYPPRRKRKPLLGRAPSHPSLRPEATGPSRASSIDTLNDDGLGSVLESADPTRDNSLSRTDSRNGHSLSSMFSGKFDFLADGLPVPLDGEDEENQEPQMTQLDYEDADAAAMRAKFLRDAGKDVKAKKPESGLGQVRELEDIGWGSGRRTRKQPSKLDDE